MNTNFENYKEMNETETNFDSKQEKRKLNIFMRLYRMMPLWIHLVIIFTPVATILFNHSTFIGFTLIPALIIPFLREKTNQKGFKKFKSAGILAFIYIFSLCIYFDIWGLVILALGLVVLEVERFSLLKKIFNFKIFMFSFSIVALSYGFDISPIFGRETVERRPFSETVLYYDWNAADNHYWAIFIWSVVFYPVFFALGFTIKEFFNRKNKVATTEDTNDESVSNTNKNEFNEANSQPVDNEDVTIIEKDAKKTSDKIDPSDASFDSGDYQYVKKSDYEDVFTPIKKWARKD
ncbi:hypothetical protein [Priestia aryabhattai]